MPGFPVDGLLLYILHITFIILLVVCLSTNGERALNYTVVIQTTKIKSSC